MMEKLFFWIKKRGRKKVIKEETPIFYLEEGDKGDFEEFLEALKKQSLIVIITGRRGSGKTALGFSILEFLKNSKSNIYVIGVEAGLPKWIKKENDLSRLKNDSAVLIDEAALSFSARESSKELNRLITKIMAIARHKNLTLIFVTQSSAIIDINILRLADVIMMKEPGLLQEKFERREIQQLYKKVKPIFRRIRKNKNRYTYVYSDWFEGLIRNRLPYFWSERISKSFAGVELKV